MHFAPPPTPAAKTEFLSAMAEWSGRPLADFPSAAPPCNALGGGAEEDRILASVFANLASDAPYYAPRHHLSFLTGVIAVHQRRYDLAWNAAKSNRPTEVADRKTWVQLKPYAAMIGVLHVWLDALYDQAMERAA